MKRSGLWNRYWMPQIFKPSFKRTLRLVWVAQGLIVSALILINLLAFWMLELPRTALFGIAAILLIAVTASLIVTPMLIRMLTLELDTEKIVVLGVMKPMFTMRWDEIEEVRTGDVLGLNAVSMRNARTGKQIGFYLLTDETRKLAAAIRAHTPDTHPMHRYADRYLG